ncbi:recombination-associated protein RdgC [Cupriavidus malaysiensis]|uniref:Recombination-associated protein RdgC n=1 Tax=Cupriavidus malaysiensis TaxID=367825 RepID=A0A1D9I3V9_9BURK|nr:recombination-associated protein RdgC [Cupriavidus malaysiensis]AOZ06797.1 recombination-associated protein RdgC [Cupriavidus malaysiensis]
MFTWFRNLSLLRLSRFPHSAADVAAALARFAFLPCGAFDLASSGWAPPLDGGGLVRACNGQLLIALRTDQKILPARVVNAATKARAAQVEQQQGFKPGRKQLRELKEQIVEELLSKAFVSSAYTRVWIDPVNGWLAIDASSASKTEDVRGMLFKSLDPLPAMMLQVNHSPVAAMTEWLATDTAPAGFTIDQELTLESRSERRATIRYARHPLDVADMGRHIAAGKRCTRLAMTWDDRVSFVLTDALTIKRMAPLDVIKEQADATLTGEGERFDADFLMMSAELATLLRDLTDALGGERKPEEDMREAA